MPESPHEMGLCLFCDGDADDYCVVCKRGGDGEF